MAGAPRPPGPAPRRPPRPAGRRWHHRTGCARDLLHRLCSCPAVTLGHPSSAAVVVLGRVLLGLWLWLWLGRLLAGRRRLLVALDRASPQEVAQPFGRVSAMLLGFLGVRSASHPTPHAWLTDTVVHRPVGCQALWPQPGHARAFAPLGRPDLFKVRTSLQRRACSEDVHLSRSGL